MMRRLPISVKLAPMEIKKGKSRINLNIKNHGNKEIETLEVGLASLDQRLINVKDSLKWVKNIDPKETIIVPFSISAHGSARLYIRIFGYMDDERFSWESPALRIKVGEEAAEIINLLILGEAKQEVGQSIKVETTIKGLKPNSSINIDYWVNTPEGVFNNLGQEKITIQKVGIEKDVITFIPQIEGQYTIYAYLYVNSKQIDRQSDKIYIIEKKFSK